MRLSLTIPVVKGLLSADEIDKQRETACHVVLWKTNEFLSDLGLAFQDEATIIIDHIRDVEFSKHKSTFDEAGIYVFKKTHKNRKCLGNLPVNSPPPEKIVLSNTESVVEQINMICKTLRKPDGYLNAKGLHKDSILKNLYEFNGPSMEDISFNRETQHWVVDGPQIPKCEKISADDLSFEGGFEISGFFGFYDFGLYDSSSGAEILRNILGTISENFRREIRKRSANKLYI